MAIKSVKMMREIRDKLNQRIEGMAWEDENIFLEKHITTFKFLVKEREMPNEAIQPAASRAVSRRSAVSGG